MTKFLKTKKEILAWFDNLIPGQDPEYKINHKKYITFIEDPVYGFVIDYKNGLDLSSLKLKEIPVKFRNIAAAIDCSNNKLTSLDWAPNEIKGDFNMNKNKLSSLKGFPQKVEGVIILDGNPFTSLEGLPEVIESDFFCSKTNISSFNGAPRIIKGIADFSRNKLSSIDNLPNVMGDDLDIGDNPLLGSLQSKTKEDIYTAYQSQTEKKQLGSAIPNSAKNSSTLKI